LNKIYLKVSLVNIVTMSDDEYYSDNNSGSDESDNEEIVAKPVIKFRPPIVAGIHIDDVGIDSDLESDEDDEVEGDEDIEDVQFGGAVEEGEINEDSEAEDSDDDDDDEDIELNEDGEEVDNTKVSSKQGKSAKNSKTKKPTQLIIEDEDEDDEDDEYDENYLQKFDTEITKNYINDFHPECFIQNYDEIAKLAVVVRNSDNIIIDPNHRTIPFLTKYEKARVLGQRAKQIETGAKPLVKISENIIDSYIIAELELREKKIPFIIRRPLPNGTCEYWYLRDLEMIGF
jgi:DNA-directed RNA polymerase I, II, and III subunit RPABC2